MASKSKYLQVSKTEAPSDDIKYKKKYKELKKRVLEIEKFNEELVVKISRVRKNVRRTKVERNLLFDKLENIKGANDHDSEVESVESEIEQVEKPVSKKAEKDPNAPKRPSNAFFVFCQLERSKLKEIHHDASLSELTKMLGQRWKVMTMDEKKVLKYYDLSAKDKQRYERAMCTYNGTVYQPSVTSNGITETLSPAYPQLMEEGSGNGVASGTELDTIDSRVESESNITVSDRD